MFYHWVPVIVTKDHYILTIYNEMDEIDWESGDRLSAQQQQLEFYLGDLKIVKTRAKIGIGPILPENLFTTSTKRLL